jgi:hypothetical protein
MTNNHRNPDPVRSACQLEVVALGELCDELGAMLAGRKPLPAVAVAELLVSVRKMRARLDRSLAALEEPAEAVQAAGNGR